MACTLVVFNFVDTSDEEGEEGEGSTVRVAAFTTMLVLWAVAVALALRVETRLCGAGTGGDDGRIMPVFGKGAEGGEEEAAKAREDLDDDGHEKTLMERMQVGGVVEVGGQVNGSRSALCRAPNSSARVPTSTQTHTRASFRRSLRPHMRYSTSTSASSSATAISPKRAPR